MVFYINSWEFAHKSRSNEGCCIVYAKSGVIGLCLSDDAWLLGFAAGRYFVDR